MYVCTNNKEEVMKLRVELACEELGGESGNDINKVPQN